MILAERLRGHGITLNAYTLGQHSTTCPNCSDGRKKKNDPCLSVKLDDAGAVWCCNHCGWQGGFREADEPAPQKQKRPRKPPPTFRPLPPKAVEWFGRRGISRATLDRAGVRWSPAVWFRKLNARRDAIAFVHRRDGQIVNAKFRAWGAKEFAQIEGGEKRFYLGELCDGTLTGTLVICEGEPDALALLEANIDCAVSVPDGAHKQRLKGSGDAKFEFIQNDAELLERFSRIVLAVDNDEAGCVLRDELLDRLGRERCFIPTWPNGCKDPNEVLLGYGVETLQRCIDEAQPAPPVSNGHDHAEGAEPVPSDLSEDSLALGFTNKHPDLRFVAPWGQWLQWDGSLWSDDTTLAVFDKVRRHLRQRAEPLRDDKETRKRASGITSAKTVAAVERLARADRQHAATIDQWDADPRIANSPGGVIDLKTGELSPHRRDDYCRKMLAVTPAPKGTPCPLWTAFLQQILPDPEVRTYLQRYAGYSLTGDVSANALLFGYGQGRNGKTVLVDTISGILGDYAEVIATDALTETRNDRHTQELAKLQGARMVRASETEQGRHWAEAKLKYLTGGDPITARFMRQNDFTFDPQFKLWIIGNHKPSIRCVDEAIRARINIVPFGVTIPPEARDPRLREKLRKEWPAILRWMIEGCLEFQRCGLNPPQAVQIATSDYLASEDVLGTFLEENTEDASSLSGEYAQWLYTRFAEWARQRGEDPGSQKAFSQALAARGYERFQEPGTKKAMFRGIRLR